MTKDNLDVGSSVDAHSESNDDEGNIIAFQHEGEQEDTGKRPAK